MLQDIKIFGEEDQECSQEWLVNEDPAYMPILQTQIAI